MIKLTVQAFLLVHDNLYEVAVISPNYLLRTLPKAVACLRGIALFAAKYNEEKCFWNKKKTNENYCNKSPAHNRKFNHVRQRCHAHAHAHKVSQRMSQYIYILMNNRICMPNPTIPNQQKRLYHTVNH